MHSVKELPTPKRLLEWTNLTTVYNEVVSPLNKGDIAREILWNDELGISLQNHPKRGEGQYSISSVYPIAKWGMSPYLAKYIPKEMYVNIKTDTIKGLVLLFGKEKVKSMVARLVSKRKQYKNLLDIVDSKAIRKVSKAKMQRIMGMSRSILMASMRVERRKQLP